MFTLVLVRVSHNGSQTTVETQSSAHTNNSLRFGAIGGKHPTNVHLRTMTDSRSETGTGALDVAQASSRTRDLEAGWDESGDAEVKAQVHGDV